MKKFVEEIEKENQPIQQPSNPTEAVNQSVQEACVIINQNPDLPNRSNEQINGLKKSKQQNQQSGKKMGK